ncbi:hypothetical protein EDB92DRAFT_1945769 [Lactarius akahatsu]|uniref:Uncharacterized protein n=1 Tax=Lactarius akahatsu TaxID=416441 RepID=A0AAD4LFK6_9AGAM|nr:hypothetical protein EDB92DRAFT_1945769 [Lactarius akahatsu]
MPFKFPRLEVALPEEYTTLFTCKHFEHLRDHLQHRTQAGGHDALTVLINARLTTQEPGQVTPTIILCESFENVPIRISQVNLQQLLLNVFLPHWLKKYKNYPLSIDNIKSVRRMKGKSGVHLDNKEHAILEYCLTKDGKKLALTELNLMLVLDGDHIEAAQAHQDSAPHADLDSESVHCLECSSVPTLLISHTEASGDLAGDSNSYAMQPQVGSCPSSCPKPHPLYGKKRKISESLSSEDMFITLNSGRQQASGSQSLGDQKRTQTWTSHMIPDTESIRQALIAQHEPPKTAIDGLHAYPLVPTSNDEQRT